MMMPCGSRPATLLLYGSSWLVFLVVSTSCAVSATTAFAPAPTIPRHRRRRQQRNHAATKHAKQRQDASASTVPPPSTRSEWEAEIFGAAQPLVAATDLSEALVMLQRDGVVLLRKGEHLPGLDPRFCHELKQEIVAVADSGDYDWEKSSSSKSGDTMDQRYVPGTRLRFGNPIDICFAGDARHDMLLPLRTNSKNGEEEQWNCPAFEAVLESATRQLLPFLVTAARQLLPKLLRDDDDDSNHSDGDYDEDNSNNRDNNDNRLELVEVAALLNRPGSNHQTLHGDYRRFPSSSSSSSTSPNFSNNYQAALACASHYVGKLPPRLVCFVALQDVPTPQHGATYFVTGTHTAEAHALLDDVSSAAVHGGSNNDSEQQQPQAAAVVAARRALMGSSTNGVRSACRFKCGDMLVYDASVLHAGGANSVPGNDRAILYFGVALPSAASLLETPTTTSSSSKSSSGMLQATPPVLLNDVVRARRRR